MGDRVNCRQQYNETFFTLSRNKWTSGRRLLKIQADRPRCARLGVPIRILLLLVGIPMSTNVEVVIAENGPDQRTRLQGQKGRRPCGGSCSWPPPPSRRSLTSSIASCSQVLGSACPHACPRPAGGEVESNPNPCHPSRDLKFA